MSDANVNILNMKLDEFRRSISTREKPVDLGALLEALWHAGAGNWHAAHSIVQSVDSDIAAEIHAYLHRLEGDLYNARYWYAQAGIPWPCDLSLEQEWDRLVRRLL